jgi:trk system potassium uptake protein TrkH
MRKLVVFRLTVVFLGFFSLTMIFPFIIAIVFAEHTMAYAFGSTMGITVLVAGAVFKSGRKPAFNFNPHEGILLVSLAWFSICVLGAVPYYLSGYFPGFSNALFESVSGFTTTGVSIIPDLEILPYSLHFWRALTQWLGGMGIIVLTVGLLPLLGVGGFQLLKAETSGPVKEKITPKITNTAKILWFIYCGLTVILALLFFAGGMTWFEAVFHALSAIATGGFSTRNDGIAAFHSPYIEWVCIVFMIIAGFNFTLLYRLLRGKYKDVINNSEAKAYFLIILVSVLMVTVSILPQSGSVEKALRRAFFHIMSIMSTTGLMADNHNVWPSLAQMVLLALMFVGGCSGSTAGGVKVIRYVILLKQAKNEIGRLLYPTGVFSLQIDKKHGEKNIVYPVAGFVCLYFLMVFFGTLLMGCVPGADLFTSFNASLICLGNIGLGRLTTGAIFYEAPNYVKWGFSFLMIAGRLELFTVLLLFIPSYWRR